MLNPSAQNDATPKITELAGRPVVGRTYLLPTVRYKWRGTEADWPVFLPLHDDAEHLDFPWRHYHVDTRFVPAEVYRRAARTAYANAAAVFQAVPLSRATGPHPPVRWLEMRCVRRLPTYQHGDKEPIEKLNETFAGKSCGRDAAGRLVCPHKGADLTSLTPDARGVVTCPLHGLRIDAARGVVLGPASLAMAEECR